MQDTPVPQWNKNWRLVGRVKVRKNIHVLYSKRNYEMRKIFTACKTELHIITNTAVSNANFSKVEIKLLVSKWEEVYIEKIPFP